MSERFRKACLIKATPFTHAPEIDAIQAVLRFFLGSPTHAQSSNLMYFFSSCYVGLSLGISPCPHFYDFLAAALQCLFWAAALYKVTHGQYFSIFVNKYLKIPRPQPRRPSWLFLDTGLKSCFLLTTFFSLISVKCVNIYVTENSEHWCVHMWRVSNRAA